MDLVHDVTADEANASGREVVAGTEGFLASTWEYVNGEGGPHLTGQSFWHSDDGQTWTEATSPIASENELLMALTTTRDGDFLVLTSVFDQETADIGDARPALERRCRVGGGRDRSPRRLRDPEHRPRPGGIAPRRPGEHPDSSDAGAWLSEDGITWERALDMDEPGRYLNGGDGGAGDEGFVVAGTSVAGDSSSHEYVVWASSDGHEWVQTRSPFNPEDPDYRPDPYVAALGGDWVAALSTPDDDIQFWFSQNGIRLGGGRAAPAR